MFSKQTKTREPENEGKAYEYAVFLLSLRLRTVGEVREKMEKRGYAQGVVEKTITQLLDQKYLNDERYAEVFLDNLKQYKNFGYFGIKKKFMLKKLPMALIERVLSEGLSVEDEAKIAKRFLKKEGVGAGPVVEAETQENSYSTFNSEQAKDRQKVFAKLKSHGFRGEAIAKLEAI